jgi:hypothetical protein
MEYDTEKTTDVEKKVITVNGKNRPVEDLITIPEEVNDKTTAEEKKKLIDLEDEDIEMEASNEEEQENRDDPLNSGDSGSDYVSEYDLEREIAELALFSEEVNDYINAQRTGYPEVTKLRSSNFGQPGSHQ